MKLEVLNVDEWPLMKEAVGSVPRSYEHTETSYILEGAGNIVASNCQPVHFNVGDLVTVMPETECVWNITEEIERHYSKG